MKKFTKEQVIHELAKELKNRTYGLDDTDNEGQVILYTGFYLWSDGKYRTEPEK